MEELNFKTIEILNTVDEIATVKCDTNFNEIRSLYPDRIKDLIKAIKSGNFSWSGDGVLINLGDAEELFDSRVILVSYVAKEGYHVASAKGIVVSLDLQITEELKQEGLARDIIRNIQDARKNIGCDILDKIKVEITGNVPKEWMDYICKETLSSIAVVDHPVSELVIETDDAGSVNVKISK